MKTNRSAHEVPKPIACKWRNSFLRAKTLSLKVSTGEFHRGVSHLPRIPMAPAWCSFLRQTIATRPSLSLCPNLLFFPGSHCTPSSSYNVFLGLQTLDSEGACQKCRLILLLKWERDIIQPNLCLCVTWVKVLTREGWRRSEWAAWASRGQAGFQFLIPSMEVCRAQLCKVTLHRAMWSQTQESTANPRLLTWRLILETFRVRVHSKLPCAPEQPFLWFPHSKHCLVLFFLPCNHSGSPLIQLPALPSFLHYHIS